jgi:hypothetical protein
VPPPTRLVVAVVERPAPPLRLLQLALGGPRRSVSRGPLALGRHEVLLGAPGLDPRAGQPVAQVVDVGVGALLGGGGLLLGARRALGGLAGVLCVVPRDRELAVGQLTALGEHVFGGR